MQVFLGRKASPVQLEPRVNLVLRVEWVLQARRDQRACREREAEPDQLVQWENVVQLEMLANPALWDQWESLAFQDFPVTQE